MRDSLRAAFRSVVHRPRLAAAIVGTLTLGIGANAAIFSAVDAILLRPLPYPAADRLVAVYESNVTRRQATQLVAPGRLEEWNSANSTFDGLAASYFENMTDTTGSAPERVEARRTSPRFFAVLGVAPQRGRTPTADEDAAGGPPVAVVSDAFWRRRLAGSAEAVGATLRLGGVARTIIGVMPPSFRYPTATTDVWIPTQAPRAFLQVRTARLYTAFGRMKPGVTSAQGETDLSAVQARLAAAYPKTDAGWSAAVVPLKEEQVGGVRRSLWLLLGAVALVLAAACGNIACLLLADGARREHEMAVRAALGASRGRLAGELLLEAGLMAAAGAILGLAVAHVGMDAIRRVATGLPRAEELSVDARLVAFSLAACACTTIGFALAPAMHRSRAALAPGLARGGRAQAAGRQSLQRILVAAQLALAVVLLTGAGVLVRSFVRLQHVDPGFDANNVIAFRMSAEWTEPTASVMNRQIRTVARLESISGALAASFAAGLPARGDIPPTEFAIVGRDAGGEHLFAYPRSVSSGYFRTLRIPVLRGEVCRDDPERPFKDVVVTRAWADRFFPRENPVGHQIQPLALNGLGPQTIVAEVGDVREHGLASAPAEIMYTCGLQPYWPDPFFFVRIDPARGVTATTIRAALREIEPSRAMFSVQPLPDALARTTSQLRLNTLLLSLFAAAALLLAAIGLYGVLSQAVAGRRREIGLRLALGARPADILASVSAQSAAMAAAGIAAGLGGALALTRLLSSLVFEVSARDPLAFAAAPVALAIVAAAATLGPARRAAGTDPMVALRDE